MIIRNPYGFFAKHNKIIHLILLIPIVILLLCFGDIFKFFQDYISAGYSTPETNITESYVTGVIFLLVFLMAFANLVIFIILASKKKNNIFYGIFTVYFLVLLLALLLFGSSMSSIEKDSLDPTFANFVRDIARLAYLPMYLVVVFNVTKGVGFNIRTLRFDGGSDLIISEEDEEDVEINLVNDTGSFKRNFVHMIRELKYYVIENKFVVTCIGVVLLLLLGYNGYKEFQIYNKTYAVNQAFKLSDFTISVKESYITDVDYRGEIIDKNKYYLAVKIGIENNGPHTAIDNSSFRIFANNLEKMPSYDKGSRFIDIGSTYKGEIIYSNNPRYYNNPEECPKAKDYVFVYELDKNEIKASYQLRIISSLTQKNNELDIKYKKITIKPQNITKTIDLGKAKADQEIKLKDTMLGNTTYKIKDYQISYDYKYSYEQCNKITNDCYNITDTIIPKGGKMILVLDDELIWDQTTQYYQNSDQDFYADFVTLSYEFKNDNFLLGNDDLIKETVNLTNITPKGLKDKKVYEVPKTLKTAEKVKLTVRIRNKYVTIVIKE